MQADSTDQLIRFLLPRTCTRGAIIKATNIQAGACRIHGLANTDAGSPGQLLGQSLIASILLLSISKGGVRQVLQLNGETGPASRVLAETRSGAVRGYIEWRDETTSRSEKNRLWRCLASKSNALPCAIWVSVNPIFPRFRRNRTIWLIYWSNI